MKPAVFLDRDGTLIEWVHHLVDPARVRLLEGVAQAILALQQAGYACVVVSNQSVIGRGMLSEDGLAAIHSVMKERLAAASVVLDGLYYCPVSPKSSDPRRIEHPDRKPGPGMLLSARSDLSLDLGRSFIVGDALSDMLAGHNAGCRASILVRTGKGQWVDKEDEAVDHVVEDLAGAARLILSLDRLSLE